MSGDASLFREIHRLRSYLRDLQEEIDRIPLQRKAFQNKQAKAEKNLADEQETIKKLKIGITDREKQIKSKGDQIERYQRQQNESTSKKEYDAFNLEIAHAREAIGKLEDEILQAMAEVEERQARLPTHEKALSAAKAELVQFEAEIGPRKTFLDEQFQDATGKLKEAEKLVPAKLKAQYDRTIQSMGADGFALVRDMNCTECYTEINRTLELRLINDEFVVCPSCGRILYLDAQKPRSTESEE
ncbi:MAG: zinc ribbon domain-containing protein [Gemmataceae bacterium]